MRCLIGVRENEEGGQFFMVDDFDGDGMNDLIAEVQRISTMPEAHKPPTFPYENIPALGMAAAMAECPVAFELSIKDDKPVLGIIQVHLVEMPPDMSPFMLRMDDPENDFTD